MSLSQLAGMIRDGAHYINVITDVNDRKTPYIVATSKADGAITKFRYCEQQCNVIMAKPIFAKYPNITVSRIASARDISLPSITDENKLAKIAFHTNTVFDDIKTIRDYFRKNLPRLDGTVNEYTKQLKKSDKYDDAGSVSVELPYYDNKFVSYDNLYIMDENNEPIAKDAFAINDVIPVGSFVMAVVRVKFERYDDKLALKFYVTGARIHTRAKKTGAASLSFDF